MSEQAPNNPNQPLNQPNLSLPSARSKNFAPADRLENLVEDKYILEPVYKDGFRSVSLHGKCTVYKSNDIEIIVDSRRLVQYGLLIFVDHLYQPLGNSRCYAIKLTKSGTVVKHITSMDMFERVPFEDLQGWTLSDLYKDILKIASLKKPETNNGTYTYNPQWVTTTSSTITINGSPSIDLSQDCPGMKALSEYIRAFFMAQGAYLCDTDPEIDIRSIDNILNYKLGSDTYDCRAKTFEFSYGGFTCTKLSCPVPSENLTLDYILSGSIENSACGSLWRAFCDKSFKDAVRICYGSTAPTLLNAIGNYFKKDQATGSSMLTEEAIITDTVTISYPGMVAKTYPSGSTFDLAILMIGLMTNGILPLEHQIELVENLETTEAIAFTEINAAKTMRHLFNAMHPRKVKKILLDMVRSKYNLTYLVDTARQYHEQSDKLILPKKFKNITELHDIVSRDYRRLTTANKVLPQHPQFPTVVSVPSTKETYGIRGPKDTHELMDWGNVMKNCIASYGSRVDGKSNMVLAVFNSDKILFNIQISNGKLNQFYGPSNSSVLATDPIRMAVEQVLKCTDFLDHTKDIKLDTSGNIILGQDLAAGNLVGGNGIMLVNDNAVAPQWVNAPIAQTRYHHIYRNFNGI